MTSDTSRRLALLALLTALAGCETIYPDPQASTFGEANRQTMMAQVVDPAPEYATVNPPTSAEHAGQAAERYRNDKVKQPERVSASEGPSS
jgi:hypothetical protein